MPQLLAAFAALAWGLPAGAHPAGEAAWSWNFTPFIVIATALVLWLHTRGARQASAWQQAAFIGGSALLFLALQSPLDTLADESFAAHQFQHLAIHALAPMLIALSAPAAPLLAGMPAALRRSLYLSIASSGAVRPAFAFLSTPVVAAAHFIAAMLFWLLPAIQETALQDRTVHDAMHFSMLLAGMFFYFCVFDSRPPPAGSAYGARVFALLSALLVNIPLGAYLSYKETLLYPAYGTGERLGLEAIVDERVGGLIQYVPGSMMFVIAVLLVLAAWRRRDARLDAWRKRGFARSDSQATAADPAELARRNTRLGLTLAGICAFMFAAAIVGGFLAHRAS
ncbi:MAG: cytochrome c oxidase assembly protein [Betaproteobacteria bacterium]